VDIDLIIYIYVDNFTKVVARWPGSVHDSHITRCSKILSNLE